MPMLTSLPTALIVVLVTVSFAVVSAIGLLAVRRRVPLPVLREHNDVAGFIFAALGVIYAVILAFMVIAVWETFEDSRRHVDAEAAEAIDLFRKANAYPDPQRAAIHDATERYVRSIIEDEWPRLREQQDSPPTEAALEGLWASVRAVRPGDLSEQSWYDSLLESLDAITELRSIRLFEAEQRLPMVMTVLLLLGAVITVAYTYLYGVRNLYGQVAMTAALAGTIGLVVSLIFVLDAPFLGDTAIGPEPFVDALRFIRSGPTG